MKRSAGFFSCTAFFISYKGTSTSSLRNHRYFILSSYNNRSINLYRINGGKKREFY